MKLELEKHILASQVLKINQFTYLDIVLKYETYLRLINYFGGYMFLKHIYKFSPKSQHQVFNDIHAMQKSKLLKIISVNNNSYILLSKTSTKYLKNKPNVAQLQSPTSTQLRTSCFLAEYIKNPKEFFNSANPYNWFLEKCRNEIKKYRIDSSSADITFLNNNKEHVKLILGQEKESYKFNDVFSKLKASRIYFDTYEDETGVVTFLILDFDRSKSWIYNSLLKKIEPIFRTLLIYKSYNIKILTTNENRKERLIKDKDTISHKGIIFLRNISVINLDIDNFFQSSVRREGFLKDIDKLEVAILQEKLRNNSKKLNQIKTK